MSNENYTYEEAQELLKKAKEAMKKANQAKKLEKRNEANQAKRVATAELCSQALEILKGIDPTFNRELQPVVTRLSMFIKGERYTREKGGNE